MNIKNKVEVRFEKYDNVSLLSDVDCPVGQIYDFTCALQQFCIQRMSEASAAQKASQEAANEEKPKEG